MLKGLPKSISKCIDFKTPIDASVRPSQVRPVAAREVVPGRQLGRAHGAVLEASQAGLDRDLRADKEETEWKLKEANADLYRM